MVLICIFGGAMQDLQFTYFSESNIAQIVPLMQDFTSHKYADDELLQRLKSMFAHDYDCVAIFLENQLIGFCGVWYQTRHYSGKSCELDHFYSMLIKKTRLDIDFTSERALNIWAFTL